MSARFLLATGLAILPHALMKDHLVRPDDPRLEEKCCGRTGVRRFS